MTIFGNLLFLTSGHYTKPFFFFNYNVGYLIGGLIVVSTSVNSVSQPVPVVIRLTDFGNLPEDFAVDIKECRLLASAYGDISSERAIIRAEELVSLIRPYLIEFTGWIVLMVH